MKYTVVFYSKVTYSSLKHIDGLELNRSWHDQAVHSLVSQFTNVVIFIGSLDVKCRMIIQVYTDYHSETVAVVE